MVLVVKMVYWCWYYRWYIGVNGAGGLVVLD